MLFCTVGNFFIAFVLLSWCCRSDPIRKDRFHSRSHCILFVSLEFPLSLESLGLSLQAAPPTQQQKSLGWHAASLSAPSTQLREEKVCPGLSSSFCCCGPEHGHLLSCLECFSDGCFSAFSRSVFWRPCLQPVSVIRCLEVIGFVLSCLPSIYSCSKLCPFKLDLLGKHTKHIQNTIWK